MRGWEILVSGILLVTVPQAADLVISGRDGETYDGGTYDRLRISGSSSITVRNCSFKTVSGSAAPGVIEGSGITLENCDFDGNVDACSAVEINGSDITFRNCWMHNAADDGVECHNGSNLKFISCIVSDLHGCGTDDGCGTCYNGHSDGWELFNINGLELVGNFAYNIKSTSAFFIGETNSNYYLANNMFYPHYAGYAIYLQDIDGVELYNNTFWKGSYGGLVLDSGVRGLVARNNIFATVNLNLSGTTLDPSEHDFDYNLHGLAHQGFTLQEHDLLAPNPLFVRAPHVLSSDFMTDPEPDDFALQTGSPAIGKGTSGGNIPDTDFFGNPRTEPYDLGAVETQAAGLDGGTLTFDDVSHAISITPNPCRGKTVLGFGPVGLQPVAVAVTDMRGRCVLRAGTVPSSIIWWGRDEAGRVCPPGCYQLTVVYPDRTEYRRIVRLR